MLKEMGDKVYDALVEDGCNHRDIVAVSTRLIELVTDGIKVDVQPRRR